VSTLTNPGPAPASEGRRRFADSRLILATHNPGKVAEIRAMLGVRVPRIEGAAELGLDAPEETGESFAENAALKARTAARAAGAPALADDSGLCVHALGGRPGVQSAPWAQAQGGFDAAMARLLAELEGAADRRGWFACVLALAWPDGHVETVEGRIEGRIAESPRGTHGFGFDPIFIPQGYEVSFAELGTPAKSAISHRARAFSALIEACFSP